MLTNYLILVASIAAATILWRTINDDHPRFKSFIQNLPLVGSSLICGVCTSFWFSLPVVTILNPLTDWHPLLQFGVGNFISPILFVLGWFATSVGVLFFRSLVIVLLEGAAILKHQHALGHGASTPR